MSSCMFEGCFRQRLLNSTKCEFHKSRSLCKVPFCRNQVYARQLCVAHGGRRPCIHAGCSANARIGSYCCRHGPKSGKKLCREPGLVVAKYSRHRQRLRAVGFVDLAFADLSFADLAFADPTLPRIWRLLTSSAVPNRFQFMLTYWFDMRVGPSTLQAPSPLCGPLPSSALKPPWLVRLHNATKLFTQMTPAEARRSRVPPRTHFQLPIRHLDVDDDFHTAAFSRRLRCRAPTTRRHLTLPSCLFCPEHETYRHFIVDCDFIKDVWSTLHAVMAPLGYLYSTPKTASDMHRAAFRYLWPVLRACVWFNVWRVRNDRVFRADLPLPSPWTIAVKAARVAQMHLHHSLVQNPGQIALCRLLRLLAQHEWPRQHLAPRIALLPPPA
ncbi:hypothetical protein SDRG_02877 [Saprolegnia diclina VS20]|uniref:Reverse transcriptase zinc-binding domain-containing protein n=1 Tax=Saprolegnia diclina (strain VS20) TaxID=1156394 RepID=T0QQ21_SAPDV|nr:hypothetical protein SDRG_02877 [Saprolegnia diclina VS20]EQC40229.1 hypothetical protein SDRG_02877 [Saprolegnia diclina VS20]|eukprot:XP_008606703.1 hypothetical protein SDRG_02877 [Saprolegnia diclina VS20]